MNVTGWVAVLQAVTQGSIFFLLNISATSGPPRGPLLGHWCSGSQRGRGESARRIVRDMTGARPESGSQHFGPHSTG